jgi:hypothetical protein
MLPILLALACGSHWSFVDADGDGWTTAMGDCDDFSSTIHPGAEELWYDGMDQNCDGNDADQDGDGWGAEDCADDPGSVEGIREGFPLLLGQEVYPGAPDRPYDGVDANCDGQNDDDADGDNFPAAAWGGTDCYDSLEDAWPDPAALGPAAVFPGAVDLPYDGTDADCAGNSDNDADKDGTDTPEDCNDSEPLVGPGQAERWYDGLDQDCDGNDGDQDGDGWWVAGYSALAGVPLPDGVADGDCADDPEALPEPNPGYPPLASDLIFPGAADLPYDGIDANCSGDGDQDGDGDGFSVEVDCDDTDVATFPGATESCDARDNNCSGLADEEGCPCAVQYRGNRPYFACDQGTGDVLSASCSVFGYQPVEGEDLAELAWLVSAGYTGAWLGLDDRAVEADFRRWDGATPGSTAWAPGQPDDAAGGEDCVYLGEDGLWYDGACGMQRLWLCRG